MCVYVCVCVSTITYDNMFTNCEPPTLEHGSMLRRPLCPARAIIYKLYHKYYDMLYYNMSAYNIL